MASRAEIHNSVWPLRREGRSWRLAQRQERTESAIRHFIRTPKSALYHHPDYGTLLYQMQGQAASADGFHAVIETDLLLGLPKYIPDIVVHSVDIAADATDSTGESWSIGITWDYAAASSMVSMVMFQEMRREPRRTMVSA